MKSTGPSSLAFSPRKSSPFHARALAFGAAVLAGISGLHADTVTYTKIADQTTTAPGAGGTFSGFSSVSIDGNNLVILGAINNNSGQGIYTSTVTGLSLARIADTTTTGTDTGVPLSGPFSSFATPSISGTNLAFVGITNSLVGAYTGTVGTTGGSLIAQRNDPAAELHEKISSVAGTAIGGTKVAFFAGYIDDGTGGVSGSGLFLGTAGQHATAAVVADRFTTAPGHGLFTSFNNNPSVDGNLMTYRGSYSGGTGIYTVKTDGTGGALIADNTTPLPDHSGTFSLGLSAPVVSGTNVAFSTPNGVYLSDATGIHTIADTSTFVPGQSGIQFGAGNFSPTISLDGGNVAFTAAYSGGSGLFLEYNGNLLAIATTTSSLFGDPVYFFNISNEALDGNHLAFNYLVNGASGTTGVAVANINSVPEPSTWTFLLGGLGSFALRRRYRKGVAASR